MLSQRLTKYLIIALLSGPAIAQSEPEELLRLVPSKKSFALVPNLQLRVGTIDGLIQKDWARSYNIQLDKLVETEAEQASIQVHYSSERQWQEKIVNGQYKAWLSQQ